MHRRRRINFLTFLYFALHHACLAKSFEVVKIILPSSKAVINKAEGYSWHGDEGCHKLLGRTPLKIAAEVACLPVVEVLVAHGAVFRGLPRIGRPSRLGFPAGASSDLVMCSEGASFNVPSSTDGDLVTEFLQAKLQAQNEMRPSDRQIHFQGCARRFETHHG